MVRSPRLLASSVALLIGASLMAAPSFAQVCPPSTIECLPPSVEPVSSTAPSRTLNSSYAVGSGFSSYDLVYGRIRVTSIGDPSGGFGMHTRVSDDYELLGPAGGPVAFSVRLYLEGNAEGRTDLSFPPGAIDVSAAVTEAGGAMDSTALHAGPGQLLPFNPTLEIPLSHAVGEPFRLTFAAHSQGGFSTGHVVGHWSFIMPPGYAMSSCQGFSGSGATAATNSTWGRVKVRYR